MAFAQVGARFILGLMSVVVFLTPAHADPAASAHASAIALKMLVRIMALLLRVLEWVPRRQPGLMALFARQRPRMIRKPADQCSYSIAISASASADPRRRRN